MEDTFLSGSVLQHDSQAAAAEYETKRGVTGEEGEVLQLLFKKSTLCGSDRFICEDDTLLLTPHLQNRLGLCGNRRRRRQIQTLDKISRAKQPMRRHMKKCFHVVRVSERYRWKTGSVHI